MQFVDEQLQPAVGILANAQRAADDVGFVVLALQMNDAQLARLQRRIEHLLEVEQDFPRPAFHTRKSTGPSSRQGNSTHNLARFAVDTSVSVCQLNILNEKSTCIIVR